MMGHLLVNKDCVACLRLHLEIICGVCGDLRLHAGAKVHGVTSIIDLIPVPTYSSLVSVVSAATGSNELTA